MSFASPPPRRGPEPLCFQPVALPEEDKRSAIDGFFLGLIIMFVAYVIGVVIARWLGLL